MPDDRYTAGLFPWHYWAARYRDHPTACIRVMVAVFRLWSHSSVYLCRAILLLPFLRRILLRTSFSNGLGLGFWCVFFMSVCRGLVSSLMSCLLRELERLSGEGVLFSFRI